MTLESWHRRSEQIPKIFEWILRGQAASAVGRGSELKYTTSGVRAPRLEFGRRLFVDFRANLPPLWTAPHGLDVEVSEI